MYERLDPDGALVRTWYEDGVYEGEILTITTTYASDSWGEPRIARSTLRFLDAETLAEFLSQAGLAIGEQYGDWDLQPLTDASPGIITIAKRV